MPTDREGDGFNALLRETLAQSTVALTECPDAERMAAWHDGVLRRADARAMELHVADCARCRALVASLVKSEPAAAPAVPLWQRWRLHWIAPLLATASAVALWIAVPPRDESPRATASATEAFATRTADEQVQAQREALEPLRRQQGDVPSPQAAGVVASPPPPPPAAAGADQQKSSENGRNAMRLTPPDPRLSTIPATAPALAGTPPLRQKGPPTQPAPEQTAGAVSVAAPSGRPDALEPEPGDLVALDRRSLSERVRSPIEIASPDPAVRWRVLLGAVELSRTGGAQWTSVTLPGASSADAVLAGNAPDGQTCWLVGRAGLVLRSIDGAAFVRAPFPAVVDLVGIRAEGAQRATVTTADGRLFETTDGGTNWTSR